MKAKDFFKNKTGLSIRSARKLKVKYTPTELVRFAEEYHTNSTHQEGGECYVECKPSEGEFVLKPVDPENTESVLNFVKKKTLPQISDWDKLREKYFEECTNDIGGGGKLRKVNIAPHDLFEWFKKNLPTPQISETAIADMIETYFKKWNGNGFDKPTPLERQGFEACANAIHQLMKGGEG